MSIVAIIGGSRLTKLKNLQITRKEVVRTPYGEPSSPLVFGRISDKEAVFLPRHGAGHTIPPHEINYRANVWALKKAGASHVIAVAAVGGISREMKPRALVLPDQNIDYTYGRPHTFFETKQVTHVDFTEPYDAKLREILLTAAKQTGLTIINQGVYGATQGPRFETAAEIRRLERDGADLVGMTGMPEASLARELGLRYAAIAVVANYAAGKEEGQLELKEIEENLDAGMISVRALLEQAIPLIAEK